MQKHFLTLLALIAWPMLSMAQTEADISSPTEGVITHDYIGENQLKSDALQMLANFMQYAKSIYTDAGTNSAGTACGYFKANSAGQNNEDGVRTNADIAMLCAFVYKYCQPAGVALPSGITYNDVLSMAKKAVAYSYSTHRSTQLKKCTNNDYWGSSGSTYVWESSLWTESLGFATWMLGNQLSATERSRIRTVIKAEADYELTRSVPTGFAGDTKAEENGWETNVLAVACALYPDDANADKWYAKMQQFAMACYSMLQDKYDDTIVDGKAAKEWYSGQNLYADYTLQNHNYFHTSYQNVVIQELCESYLALKCMQQAGASKTFPLSETLLWNQQPMFNAVLKELALADGELVMPTGNDWSMFLYDQLPAYTGMATIFGDADALMLENMAFKYTKARQGTTNDGSWMLNSDIGPRRMGVTGHRVMMTYLMHEFFPVGSMQPTEWDTFRLRHAGTKYFETQNLVRSMSKDRFTCFYWNDGQKRYSGIVVPNTPDNNKIMVPFSTHNTGNILGTYSRADNTASIKGNYALFPEGYAMNGQIMANGGQIPQSFCLYATSGNAVILIDALKANSATSVSVEQGGMMGISVDPFMKEKRTIYYGNGNSISHIQTDGSSYSTWNSTWANIDNTLGFVCLRDYGNTMAFGDRSLNNSIYTAKIYPAYSASSSQVGTEMNHKRVFVYYSNVNAERTKSLATQVQDLTQQADWVQGWHGVIACDPDGTHYMLLSNLFADDNTPWPLTVTCRYGAPVFNQTTNIAGNNSSATFYCVRNFNIAQELRVFVEGEGTHVKAVQADENPSAAYISNESASSQTVSVTIIAKDGNIATGSVTIPAGGCKFVEANGSGVNAVTADFPGDYRNVAYGTQAYANSYEGAHLPFAVLDGQEDTYYQTLNNASSGSEYLAFRLRNKCRINKIVVSGMEGLAAPTSVVPQYGQTDGSFVNIPGCTTTTQGNDIIVTFSEVEAKFVKVKLLGGSNRVAVKKVAIYGGVEDKSQAKDVTDQYFQNPSFEADSESSLTPVNNSADGLRGWTLANPTGWNVTGNANPVLLVNANCYTDNNFGKVTTIPDGSHAYYLRMGWNTGSNTVKQTLRNVPAGRYRLSMDHRSAYNNGATSSFKLRASSTSTDATTFNEGSANIFTTLEWNTASVGFELASTSDVEVAVDITWQSGGSCIMIDNFRLFSLESTEFDYEALKQQIISNDADATFLIQNPDGAAADGWEGAGLVYWIKESWTGSSEEDNYLERTSNGTISQYIEHVPAGTYKLVAAARSYNGGKVTARINQTSGTTFNGKGNADTNIDQINTNGVQMPYSDKGGFAAQNNTCHGWQWISATATVAENGSMTIAFDMVGTSWMSVDDIHLFYISDGTQTFCESVNADANTPYVEVNLPITCDVIVANPNTVINSSQLALGARGVVNNSITDGMMNAMVLYDGYNFDDGGNDYTASEAVLYRQLDGGKWVTLMVPFTPSNINGRILDLSQFNANSECLTFKEVESVDPDHPYLVNLSDAISTLAGARGEFEDLPVPLTKSVDGAAMYGTYTRMTDIRQAPGVTTSTPAYVLSGGKFYLVDSQVGISPFRAYFMANTGEASVNVLNLSENEEPDAIQRVNEADDNNSPLYNLNGQQIRTSASGIQDLPKGVYISAGKKIIK
ncbi:MAG: hypothetical protein IKH26_01870 [Bacteroidaceae bacterium]|nr:hypothetical protein [Bacteroidaceae bacterium]